jgi:hypothetical protein
LPIRTVSVGRFWRHGLLRSASRGRSSHCPGKQSCYDGFCFIWQQASSLNDMIELYHTISVPNIAFYYIIIANGGSILHMLEYRLENETVLFHLTGLSETELEIRKMCDFYIKEGVVYSLRDLYAEPKLDIIYIAPDPEEKAYGGERVHNDCTFVELREFKGEESLYHPVVHVFSFHHLEQVLQFARQESVSFDGAVYTRSALELDEDRNVLVYYGIKQK